MEARRRGGKGRIMRGEDDIGDAGATGITRTPHGREEQQKRRWHKEIGRQQGREDKRESTWGGHKKSAKNSLRNMKEGGL
jgi:hypothetical protein